jgi:hypothetical protein
VNFFFIGKFPVRGDKQNADWDGKVPFGIENNLRGNYFWQGVKISKRGSISRATSFGGITVRQRAGIIITFSGKRKRIISRWV